jgi:predicted ATP-grasp superfamily ATP-dependent carboligase
MNKLLIVTIPFPDWEDNIRVNPHLLIRNGQILGKNILPICQSDYFHKNSIFKNTKETIEVLDNKSKFGKYMLQNFPEYIPTIYYYQFLDETYVRLPENEKLIQKPNTGCGGQDIKIVYSIEPSLKNHIISKYIEHKTYYAGHFLVKKGIICEKVFFCSSYSYINGIKMGRIINYTILPELLVDDSIFNKIFSNLSYSGFADCDFTIVNDKIIIFEINPRPGGSLIQNKVYFDKFIDCVVKLKELNEL